MATRYWAVSLPVAQSSSTSALWSRLQESISKNAFETFFFLKIEDLERFSGVVSSSLTVDGVLVDSYLTRFVWDEAKYPTMSPLREIVDGIHVQIAKIEDDLKESISKNAFDTSLYRFNIPNLRVGTLDSLLALSDDLLKSNNFIEGVSHKIRRQIEDLERFSGVVSSSLTVDGVLVDSYLTRFVWDEAKYPTMSPLREIVDGIHVQIAKIEDDLKVRVAEYNNVRSQLNAINRKQAGSLAVRDLSNLVKPQDIITSEHLTTLLAIVPKYSQKDWLSSYEGLTSYVILQEATRGQ
ncbi:unnamed protein product [Fraxinus pennsylvanica]|uniref:V-type proton ATPase subunit C n=1 Tax=Fraxinus pennsylvanica TaxID=56036 RepID=A0AAD2AGL9_9LAMI|nr:unnamed protein product [Fraxinus pennsylvanica]